VGDWVFTQSINNKITYNCLKKIEFPVISEKQALLVILKTRILKCVNSSGSIFR